MIRHSRITSTRRNPKSEYNCDRHSELMIAENSKQMAMYWIPPNIIIMKERLRRLGCGGISRGMVDYLTCALTRLRVYPLYEPKKHDAELTIHQATTIASYVNKLL